ncbi:MAG TPA: TaqI-like C-terminal specificity domain-containing protein, partial [Tepidisphaeraceae bacterium]|nr:TaqI-like C-terminal specificity domain-containing protein [Tepidisphaeraceae bacterium]
KGTQLTEYAGAKPFYGVKTGFNDAFIVDRQTRDALVAADPRSSEIIRPFLRGQDVERWVGNWPGLYMIFVRRGLDINQYPAILAHLMRYRTQLEPKPRDWKGENWAGRKPGSYKWFEIQDPIEYWQDFARPKIIYQEIQFHPWYAFDSAGMLGNNKTFFISSGDLWLLAVLNSPLMWWHNWRYLPHMKDEAMSPVGCLMESLPIARPSSKQRAEAEAAVQRLIQIAEMRRAATRTILDWLNVEFEVLKPTLKLQAPSGLDTDAFVAEVKKSRSKGQKLTAAALGALRDEHTRTITPLRDMAAEALSLERNLSDLVNTAYGLTPDEVRLMWETAPPRMPIGCQPSSPSAT